MRYKKYFLSTIIIFYVGSLFDIHHKRKSFLHGHIIDQKVNKKICY